MSYLCEQLRDCFKLTDEGKCPECGGYRFAITLDVEEAVLNTVDNVEELRLEQGPVITEAVCQGCGIALSPIDVEGQIVNNEQAREAVETLLLYSKQNLDFERFTGSLVCMKEEIQEEKDGRSTTD